MNLPMENLTEQEIELFANIANASVEQQMNFRAALTMLMRCYGQDPQAAALVLYVDYERQLLSMNYLNMKVDMGMAVLEQAYQTAMQEMAKADSTVVTAPTTVQ